MCEKPHSWRNFLNHFLAIFRLIAINEYKWWLLNGAIYYTRTRPDAREICPKKCTGQNFLGRAPIFLARPFIRRACNLKWTIGILAWNNFWPLFEMLERYRLLHRMTLIVNCNVTPKSRVEEVSGWQNDILKIKVRAPPEKGKAKIHFIYAIFFKDVSWHIIGRYEPPLSANGDFLAPY